MFPANRLCFIPDPRLHFNEADHSREECAISWVVVCRRSWFSSWFWISLPNSISSIYPRAVVSVKINLFSAFFFNPSCLLLPVMFVGSSGVQDLVVEDGQLN